MQYIHSHNKTLSTGCSDVGALGGHSRVKADAMHARVEGEFTHLSTYANSPIYHTLLSMATTFIAVLKSTCYDYYPGYLKALRLEIGEWLDGKEYVRNRGP